MSTTLEITAAGTLTLPDEIRRQCGLEGPATVEVELTREGILIRPPAHNYPVETYTDDRVAEFEKNNEQAVRDYLARRPA